MANPSQGWLAVERPPIKTYRTKTYRLSTADYSHQYGQKEANEFFMHYFCNQSENCIFVIKLLNMLLFSFQNPRHNDLPKAKLMKLLTLSIQIRQITSSNCLEVEAKSEPMITTNKDAHRPLPTH